jgi:hypothetical protein
MQVRHLRTIGSTWRSPVEPGSGLLSGTGTHTLTLTVGGSRGAELPLGERGFVTALLDWAGTRGEDVGSLALLRAATSSMDAAELVAMLQQLQHLLDTLGTNLGWALFASSTNQTRTLARALIASVEPTVLLATPTAAVGLGRDGLRLRLRGLTVHSWHHDADRILLRTTVGEHTLRKTSITAALLHRIADGHSHAALVRRPVAELAGPLLAGLQTAAALTDHKQPLLLESRPPEPGQTDPITNRAIPCRRAAAAAQ